MGSAEIKRVWVSLSAAAAFVDVPNETILRVSIPWQENPVAHRIRFSLLRLDADSKGEPRYFTDDVENLLSVGGIEQVIAAIAEQVPAQKRRNRLHLVERGIYRDVKSHTLFERPFIDGKRTCRSLGTTKITKARAELRRRKAAREDGEKDAEPAYVRTVGDVIRLYQDADYPDKQLNPRNERTKKEEARHCTLLLKYWDSVRVKLTSIVTCDKYRDWRLQRVKQGSGFRTIDRELMTLNNAFRFAYRRGQVGRNPLVDRPRYQPSKHVVHCRQCMPGDANELHEIARLLFSFRTSEVLGFQLLFTAYTGQRTCEILKLRIGAGPDEPGSIMENGKCLRVWRAKGQDIVNPFCSVHDGLGDLIAAHKRWIALRYPDATWFFPGHQELETKQAASRERSPPEGDLQSPVLR